MHKSISLLATPLHISRHLAAISIGILAGVAAVLLVDAYVFVSIVWLLLAAAMLITALSSRRAILLPLAFAGGCLIGLWRGSVLDVDLAGYEPYRGQEVVINGQVAEDATYGPEGEQRLRISDVTIDGQDLPGRIWVSSPDSSEIKRGDLVELEGRLESGFGDMPAAVFEARVIDIKRPVPGDLARRFRDRFVSHVKEVLPEPSSTLGSSFLFGQRSLLSEDLNRQLRLLGLTHLVVASGFHLTMVIREVRRRLSPLSKYLAVFFGFVVIAGFLLVTGFSTSMTRAAMVAGLSLLAWYRGRALHPIMLLLVVAASTVIIDPSSIWSDAGWYLSFSAFAGVIILAPLLHNYFWGYTPPGIFRRTAVDTTSATVTTLPIIAYTFGQYSPLALVSNLLVLPAVPIAMVFVTAAGSVAAVSVAAGKIVGLPALALLGYVTTVSDWLAASPLAYGEIELSLVAVLAAYLAIAALTVLLWLRTGLDLNSTNPVN